MYGVIPCDFAATMVESAASSPATPSNTPENAETLHQATVSLVCHLSSLVYDMIYYAIVLHVFFHV